MKRHYALAALASLTIGLPACGTVGNVFSKTGRLLMDPSIPIGVPSDQATQMALSLTATATVNPAAPSLPTEIAPDFPAEGKFAVTLSSDSEEDLAAQMRTALQMMQAGMANRRSPWAKVQPKVMEEALPSMPSSNNWLTGGSAFSLAGTTGRASGQYETALDNAPQMDAPPYPQKEATPIAFKILQLKDDSLLLSADYDMLANDLKKTLGTTYLADDDYVLRPGQFKFVGFQPLKAGTNYVAVVASFNDIDQARWKQVIRVQPKGRTYSLLVTFDDSGVNLQDEN
jgi:type VI secretion system VasD/TssJ family lipoprotein